MPAAAISQTTPPERGDHEVARGERVAEVIREGEEAVPGPGHAGRELGVVALAGKVQHGRHALRRVVARREGLERRLVQPPGALAAARDEHDGPLLREPEPAPRPRAVLLLCDQRASRHGAPDDPVLPTRPTGERIGEEDALRERGGEAVREPELRVGLRQGGRDAEQPRRRHHRPRRVAAGPEHDVGPATPQDPDAGGRCLRRHADCLQRRQADVTGNPADVELVHLVAGVDEDATLSARRPGEGHVHPASRQLLRDCQSRQHVPRRSPGPDRAP